MLNMYVRCGSVTDAITVFDVLGEKDVVTWTAMIVGYAQQEGMGQEGPNIYNAMRMKGIATPDAMTYVCLLEACANVGALHQGKELHSEIREGGLESNVPIATSLVGMYARFGRLEVSREVFDRLPLKNLVTWNALLKAYAEHDKAAWRFSVLRRFLKEGRHPDEVTYICLLTACSHAGLANKGQGYFETMEERHGVSGTSHAWWTSLGAQDTW